MKRVPIVWNESPFSVTKVGGTKLIKAVIFDFDGLILDTETVWYEAFKVTLSSYNLDLPLVEFVKCVGTEDTVFHQYLIDQLGEDCNIEDIEATAKKIHNEKMQGIVEREGVRDYLEEAENLGYKIALASSSTRKWVTHYLTKLGLIDYFSVIVTGDQVEQVKPAPDLYVKATKELNIQASEGVAFEDSLNGLQAAVAAGLNCVIVPNPITEALPFENHHLRLRSMADKKLAEVIKYLER